MKLEFEYRKGCNKHINQDVYGYRDNYYWVIDGATDVYSNYLLSKRGDVYWIVQQLNRALKQQSVELSLAECVRNAIITVRKKALQLSPNIIHVPIDKAPSYAICCVHCLPDTLEYLILGDCSLIVSYSPDNRISDYRILPFHYHINDIKNQYMHDPELYEREVKKAVRKIKRKINKEDGYWIGTLDPKVVDKAVTGEIPWKKGDSFILCSDGFMPSIKEAGLVSFSNTDIFDKTTLELLLKRQNRTENQYKKNTGIDISDDKTVLLVNK